MPPQGNQGMPPQGNPGMPPQGNPGMPGRNPYQSGGGFSGTDNTGSSRKEAWDAQYRQNHWSNQPGNQPPVPPENPGMPQKNPYRNGAFSGVPQEIVEGTEKREPLPGEKMEIKEEAVEQKEVSEPHIVDSEQDAGIVLEAAEEVVKLEEKAKEEES